MTINTGRSRRRGAVIGAPRRAGDGPTAAQRWRRTRLIFLLFGLTLILWSILPAGPSLLEACLLVGAVFAYTSVAGVAIRLWRRYRFTSLARFHRMTMNALAVADMTLFVSAAT